MKQPRKIRRPVAKGRGPRGRGGFTLVEVMICVVILLLTVAMVSVLFKNIRKVTASTAAVSETGQIARNLFSQIEQDLGGVSRTGFLLVRHEAFNHGSGFPSEGTSFLHTENSGNALSGLSTQQTNLLVRTEDNQSVTIAAGRVDWLAMTTTGAFNAQSDARSAANSTPEFTGLTSNAARVIYAHTNRVLGNRHNSADDKYWRSNPQSWATNWTLVRQQTLLIPLLGTMPGYQGDGDGSAVGRSLKQTTADVADLTTQDLLSYIRPATEDFLMDDHIPNGEVCPRASTAGDFRDWHYAAMILRVKRDDLTQDQITSHNPADPTPATASTDPASSGSPYDFYFYNGSTNGAHPKTSLAPPWQGGSMSYYGFNRPDWPTTNAMVAEGYQRPRVLAIDPANPDSASNMYGRIAAPRCAHFRVDYSFGLCNERGQLVWDMEDYENNGNGPCLTVDNLGPQTAAWAEVSSRTYRDWMAYTNNHCFGNGDGSVWPRAIRVQVIIVDSQGRDPVGYLYQRVISLSQL